MLPSGTKRISSVFVYDWPGCGGDLAATIFVAVGWGVATTGGEPGFDQLARKIETSPPATSAVSRPTMIGSARFLWAGRDGASTEGEGGTGVGIGLNGIAGGGWSGWPIPSAGRELTSDNAL